MEKLTLRVTKWMGDIPVETHCTQCADVSFKAQGASHRPNRGAYQKLFHTQFDAHAKVLHSVAQSSAPYGHPPLIRTGMAAVGQLACFVAFCPIRVCVRR